MPAVMPGNGQIEHRAGLALDATRTGVKCSVRPIAR